jgi:hypothetical protein
MKEISLETKNRKGSRRRAWLAGLLGGLALVTTGLAACGYPAATSAPVSAAYVGVCVDPHTGLRVADSFCGGADPYSGVALDHAGYLWDYYSPSYTGVIAAYHQPVVGVTIIHTVPASTSTHVIVIDRGASATGGSVTSVRAAAAASHSQTTERQRVGAGATKPGSPTAGRTGQRTGSPAPAGPTRNSSIQRGGFGIPPRAR